MGGKPFDLTGLFQQMRLDLHAFVTRLVGVDESEDILQDAWLKVRVRGNPETWRNLRVFPFTQVGLCSASQRIAGYVVTFTTPAGGGQVRGLIETSRNSCQNVIVDSVADRSCPDVRSNVKRSV